MDIITSSYLERIKNFSAGFSVCCATIGLISTFITNGPLSVKVALIILGLYSAVTLLIKQVRIIYYTQVLILIGSGIMTLLFGKEVNVIGDLLILAGIHLACTYRILKAYSYKIILSVIILIAGLKIVFGLGSLQIILTTALSGTLVVFMWSLLKIQTGQYLRESHKNESLARVGLNAGNFIHNLHLSTAMRLINGLNRFHETDNREKGRQYIDNLKNWVNEKINLRHQIVAAVNMNRTMEPERIDIHKTLEAVITTLFFDREVFKLLKVQKDFVTSDLYLDAIPFEIYYIFQNIMSNSVEAMFKNEEDEKLLTIETRIKKEKMIINIIDTGPGFPLKRKREADLKSQKETGGYGTRYVTVLMQNYLGVARYFNTPAGGACVSLEFPRKS